jgi:GTPase
MTGKTATRAGFVAILGAPNAGKSTLFNKLIGQKISITSPKPQTTRMKVTGICAEDETQIVFIDTPGIFEPKRRLDRAMVRAAWDAIEDADVIVLLIDAGVRRSEKVDTIIEELRRRKRRATLALNKIDTVVRAKLLPLAQNFHDTGVVENLFMISAKTGDGLEDLKKHLAQKMPPSPWFFDEDQISDVPSQILAAEITREQLYRQLQQELPYAATVRPESWETKKDGSVVIRQTIIVARKTHRPIILGAGGARIKSIGEAARKDIAKFLGHPAHLFLEVKCDETWQDRPELYKMFGLEFKTPAKR